MTLRGDHCYAANKPGCGGWKSAWGFREGSEAASGNPNGSGEADATRRSEQRKDAEKEWSWLRDLNGSSGLSEVESGGPSAQRCTGGFEPGLSLVLSPCRSPGDPASHCDWLATTRWGAGGTRTAFEPQKGGQAEEEKWTQAFSL